MTWDGGFGLDVRTREIEQLGEVMERRFTMRGDHPPELLGHNTGLTAIETLMAALGSCMGGHLLPRLPPAGSKSNLYRSILKERSISTVKGYSRFDRGFLM